MASRLWPPATTKDYLPLPLVMVMANPTVKWGGDKRID
jgi:hypothetical protein